MAISYLIRIPRDHPAEVGSSAPDGLTMVFSHPAVSLWTNSDVIPLGDRGCVIGHLFSRSSPSRVVSRLGDDALHKIWDSNGRSLLDV